jgi:hypothetical protein
MLTVQEVEEGDTVILHLPLRAPASEVLLLLAPTAAAPTRGLPARLLPLHPAAGTARGKRQSARSGSVAVVAVVAA